MEVLRSDAVALMLGVVSLKEETRKSLVPLSALHHVRTRQEGGHVPAGPNQTPLCGHLALGLPASRAVVNKYL